jgi:hypothetical protein
MTFGISLITLQRIGMEIELESGFLLLSFDFTDYSVLFPNVHSHLHYYLTKYANFTESISEKIKLLYVRKSYLKIGREKISLLKSMPSQPFRFVFYCNSQQLHIHSDLTLV